MAGYVTGSNNLLSSGTTFVYGVSSHIYVCNMTKRMLLFDISVKWFIIAWHDFEFIVRRANLLEHLINIMLSQIYNDHIIDK